MGEQVWFGSGVWVDRFGLGGVCVDRFSLGGVCVDRFGLGGVCVDRFGLGGVCVDRLGSFGWCMCGPVGVWVVYRCTGWGVGGARVVVRVEGTPYRRLRTFVKGSYRGKAVVNDDYVRL